MPEYVRKKRYLTYHSPLCKKYLRMDFDYKCAYCGRHEAESIEGPYSFEIDHFKPYKRFKHEPNINSYENLFYSCPLCNGKTGKSDRWSENLLNPCGCEIYGNQDVHHILPNYDEHFKLNSKTSKGEEYIKIFNLNQKRHRSIRRSREEYRKQFEVKKLELEVEIEKRIQILRELEDNNKELDLSRGIDLLEQELIDIKKRIVGAYYYNIDHIQYFDEEFEDRFERILRHYVEFKKTYDEFDLHYEIYYRGEVFRGYLRIVEQMKFNHTGKKQIRISNEQLGDWLNLEENIIVFVFDCNCNDVYYLFLNDSIENKEVNKDSCQYTLEISIQSKISEQFTELIIDKLKVV